MDFLDFFAGDDVALRFKLVALLLDGDGGDDDDAGDDVTRSDDPPLTLVLCNFFDIFFVCFIAQFSLRSASICRRSAVAAC